MKRFLLAFIFCLFAVLTNAQTVELKVYRDWRGSESNYKALRPFFTISDIYELKNFWKDCNSKEAMPSIDFDRAFLLVWHPGSVMYDHHGFKIEKFVSINNQLLVIIDYEKWSRGGFWRKPFVATLLSRPENFGNIHIQQKPVRQNNNYAHLFTIWDMNQVVTQQHVLPTVTPKTSYEQNTKTSQQISLYSPPTPTTTSQVTYTPTPQTQIQKSTYSQNLHSKPTQSVVSQRPPPTSTTKPANVGFAPPKTQATPKTQTTETRLPPAMEDDPLFGSAFDIKF